MNELGKSVGQAARTDIVNSQYRIRCAQLRATIDDFLGAALHFGVATLHRIEVEIRGIGARGHRRRCAAAHSDQHSRSAQMDEQRALRQPTFGCMFSANVAHAAGDHDRLVIAADFSAHVLFERPKISREIRPPELVVERRGADRSIEHDRKRRRDAVGLSGVRFPGLFATVGAGLAVM